MSRQRLPIAFLLVFTLAAMPACSAPEGLSPQVGDSLSPKAILGNGRYTLVRAFSPGRSASGWADTGRPQEDATAHNGRAWEAAIFKDQPRGAIAVGRIASLAEGDYVAFARLKPMAPSDGERVASIEVVPSNGGDPIAVRAVRDSDLRAGQYTAVPLAFRTGAGGVEIRVRWGGYVTTRVDSLELYRREGGPPTPPTPRAPAAVLSGQPRNLTYAGTTSATAPIPRSAKPAPDILLMDLRRLPPDWHLAALSLQGLVNRQQPRVFCLQNNSDMFWLQHSRERGWVRKWDSISGPRELLKRYRSLVRGVVVTDPAMPVTLNIATMLAGTENAIIASPRVARELKLPVLHDLRGRWKTNTAAYSWAFERLWPKLNHNVASFAHQTNMMPRDYLVQHKVFTFWITGPVDGVEPGANPTEEARLMERVLARMPANIPVLGYPYAGEDVGIQEVPGVSLLSRFGKYLIATDFNSNLSFHSGIPTPALKLSVPPAPALQNDKVYLSFIVSDGDNLQVLTNDSFPNLWRDPRRGRIPIGWTVSPAAAALIPGVMDWYYRNATPNDAFVGAVSGIGYMYPDDYAERFRTTDQGRVLDGFLAQTAAGMKAMDLRTLWIMRASSSDLFEQYARRLPGLDAIYPDYGRQVSNYADATFPTYGVTPVFRAVTLWSGGTSEQRARNAVEQIRAMAPAGRPAFMHVFFQNWNTDFPTIERILRDLGPGYVPVRPDHMGQLYREWLGGQRLMVRMPASAGTLEGYPLTAPVTLMNLTKEPMEVSLSLEPGQPNMAIVPRIRLAPGDPVTVPISGNPRSGALTVRASEPGGRHEGATMVTVTPKREIVGSELPAGVQFTRRYEAETMSHGYGTRQADPQASNGAVWISGEHRERPTGHLVYGPYETLPSGRYACLFRIKRTGPGTGNVVNVDVTVRGGRIPLGERIVSADELPDGEYRSVVVEIDYTGGDLETRIQQAGTSPIAVDTVTLLRLPE